MRDTLRTSDRNKPWSDDFIEEWRLFEASNQETKRKFGSIHHDTIEKIRGAWGYRPNRNWRQRDFDMLFDRIYLKLSLKEIAKKYPWEDPSGKSSPHKTTVQRITSELAELLYLPLPRAAYKKDS
jgi:hypothetical protein